MIRNVNSSFIKLVSMVEKLRNDRGLSLRDMAKECGVSISTIGRIENGGEPTLESAMRIAKYFKLSIEELWIDENGEPRRPTRLTPQLDHAAQLSPTFGTVPQPDIEGMLDVLSLRQENASLRQQLAGAIAVRDLEERNKIEFILQLEHAEAEVARLREALQRLDAVDPGSAECPFCLSPTGAPCVDEVTDRIVSLYQQLAFAGYGREQFDFHP